MDLSNVSPFIRGQLEPKANGGIEPPKNIILNVASAYQQYITMREDHAERVALYAAIKGMISGNPPYDEAELEANGLGHIANFNNFRARSSYERSAQGFWNLINSTEVFVKIVLNPSLGIPKPWKWAKIMARHFSDVMKEWEDFAPNFNLLGSQLVMYGICPIFFPHEESPIWEVVDVARFYIPGQSQSFVSKWGNVCIDTTYTVQQLYQIYQDAGENDYWNKKALERFLLFRANNFIQTVGRDMSWNVLDLQRFIDTNSSDVMRYFTDTVRLTNMYQKEYDGKISHYIFSADMYTATDRDLNDTKDFLFFVDRQYSNIEEAIVVFTASPGEWDIHANIGVGQKIFAASQAINMMDCSIVDMAKMSATPLIKTLSAGGRDGSNIRFYPGVATDIGAAEFQQNNLGSNINQLVGASQYLAQTIEMNAVSAGDDPGQADRSQGSISPSEARSKAFSEFGVLKNVVAHFYNTFDKVIRRVFIAFLKMDESSPGYEFCKEWKTRCKEDGVPDSLFDSAKLGLHGLPRQFRAVRASRVAGDGSTLARIMALEALAPIMGTFDDEQIQEYKKEWVESTVGVDNLDRFAGDELDGDEVRGGTSLACQEDNGFEQGFRAIASADNDQAAHADEHMGRAAEIQKRVVGQQMSPIDGDKFFTNSIPHLEQHIQFMQKAPQFYRETLNRLMQPFKQLKQWAALNKGKAQQMLQTAVRKQQEEAAASQQVMDDAQRKDFVARTDQARKDRDQQSKDMRAEKANEVRGDLMKDKARDDTEIKRMKAEKEAAIKESTARGRTELDLAKRSPEELQADLDRIVGNTPSTIDFEPI